MTALIGAGVFGLIVLIILVALLVRLKGLVGGPVEDLGDTDSRWLFDFSISRYKPMERLLDEGDYRFLASQPGYRPEIGRKLRKTRRQIFRGYLRRMVRDFNRIHAAARVMVVHSPADSSELAAVLFKQRLVFAYAVSAVRVRLVLHTVGIGTVDVSGLIRSFDEMRLQVCRFAAPVPEFGHA